MDIADVVELMCKALPVGSAAILIWCALSMAIKSGREKAQLEKLLRHRTPGLTESPDSDLLAADRPHLSVRHAFKDPRSSPNS